MNAPLVFAANAAVTVAAIFAYDVLRDNAAPAVEESASAAVLVRLDELDRRVAESAAARAGSRAPAGIPLLESRLAAVESRLAEAGVDGGAPGRARENGDPSTDAPALTAPDPDAPPIPAESARFKRLMQAYDAERETERSLAMVDQIASRLNLQLSSDQRQTVADALGAFWRQQRERMTSRTAQSREEMFAAIQTAQSDLARKLESVLPASDAAAFSSAVLPPRGAPGGGGPGMPIR